MTNSTRSIPLYRLVALREYALRSGNVSALALLDRLITQRNAEHRTL
ncbi:hypothetical protein [Nocardia niigatensis]|nr:hypothetical protein [Nocardia niigatensis]